MKQPPRNLACPNCSMKYRTIEEWGEHRKTKHGWTPPEKETI